MLGKHISCLQTWIDQINVEPVGLGSLVGTDKNIRSERIGVLYLFFYGKIFEGQRATNIAY